MTDGLEDAVKASSVHTAAEEVVKAKPEKVNTIAISAEKVLLDEPSDEIDLEEMVENEARQFKIHGEYDINFYRGNFKESFHSYFQDIVEVINNFEISGKFDKCETFSMKLKLKPGCGRQHLMDESYWPLGTRILKIE